EIYQNYEYRLVDFSMPISFNENNSSVIYFKGDPNLYKKEPVFDKIKNILGDLYIVQSEWRVVQFYRFADTSFNFVKYQSDEPGMEAFSGPHSKWEFRNNRLYRFSGMELISYDFNIADTTITNRRVLLSSGSALDSIGVDRNFKYAARISGDSLKIYDIDKEGYINSISIADVNRPMRPVVDSPYVYLHQTTRIITNVKKENNPSVKSYWLSAYPNPFNPVTTLQFNIPVAGQVELKIYDLLGKEVTMLVNEEMKAGNYKVQFNASSLPSGIYLCRMSAGTYAVTRKVVLLK
ncbi:MAG: T9SS type A sorting domain-containing protein, partial [Bacillota bacterium]